MQFFQSNRNILYRLSCFNPILTLCSYIILHFVCMFIYYDLTWAWFTLCPYILKFLFIHLFILFRSTKLWTSNADPARWCSLWWELLLWTNHEASSGCSQLILPLVWELLLINGQGWNLVKKYIFGLTFENLY